MRDSRMRYALAPRPNHYRMSMQLILVIPGLLGQAPQALAAAPSLAAIARYAASPAFEFRGIAAALIGALGAPVETPIAPFALLGAGIDPGADYVMSADPVFLAADRDNVVLMQRVDDLTTDAASALAATLNRHFDADGVHFLLARPDAWFVRCANAPEITTTPFDAAHRRGLYPNLPRGADGGTWKRWQNEIGMLLHEHPVNVEREANGSVPVNGVWFWGGGRLADVSRLPAAAVTAAPGRVGDVARGIARHGGGTVCEPQADDTTTQAIERAASAQRGETASSAVAIVVVDAVDSATDMAALDSRWLAPAVALLSRRRIDTLDFLADGNGGAAHWTAKPPTSWRRLLTSVHGQPFAVPAPPES